MPDFEAQVDTFVDEAQRTAAVRQIGKAIGKLDLPFGAAVELSDLPKPGSMETGDVSPPLPLVHISKVVDSVEGQYTQIDVFEQDPGEEKPKSFIYSPKVRKVPASVKVSRDGQLEAVTPTPEEFDLLKAILGSAKTARPAIKK